jgi:hypothetical protein
VTTIGPSGSLYADGTDASAFQVVARSEMTALRQSPASVALDHWAINCIDRTVQTHGNEVGWPADMIVSRWHPQPIRIAVIRRVDSNCALPHPAYSHP